MASLKFEGALNGLKDKQIQFIRDVIEKRGFNNNKVNVAPVGNTGDNYAANVSRITVVVEGGEDFKMIAKIAPENEVIRKGMNTATLFKNETLMYEEVLPKLVGLQKAANVPQKDLFLYAECYGCLREEPYEVILLKDLKASNFEMLDRFTSLDNDAVRLILRNFALLHSLSYVLKNKDPETFARFGSNLIDVWSAMPEDFQFYMAKLETDAISIVDEKYKKSIKGVVSQMTVISENVKKSEKYSKHTVFNQGDSWTNNIMFKLVDGIPSECINIDYQISKEGNPACDLLYMIFNCTDHATRVKYYYEWIDYYHDQLDKSLSEYGMKANFVYPRDQLDADLRSHSLIFFGVSVIVYTAMCKTHEEAALVKDAMKEDDVPMVESFLDLGSLSTNTLKLYKSRVEDLVESYRLFEYL